MERRVTELRLRGAQKIEAVGRFTGGAAHDFNNLLMAILGSLELLRKRLPADPRALALLDNAVLGAKRGASLTQRMLAFARRQELKQEAVDVSTLIEDMRDKLQQSIGAGIRLALRHSQARLWAHTDGQQLKAALHNLVINDRDAMAVGGLIEIEISEQLVAGAHPTGLNPGRYVFSASKTMGAGWMNLRPRARLNPPFTTYSFRTRLRPV